MYFYCLYILGTKLDAKLDKIMFQNYSPNLKFIRHFKCNFDYGQLSSLLYLGSTTFSGGGIEVFMGSGPS